MHRRGNCEVVSNSCEDGILLAFDGIAVAQCIGFVQFSKGLTD